jgi:hypothetical protein
MPKGDKMRNRHTYKGAAVLAMIMVLMTFSTNLSATIYLNSTDDPLPPPPPGTPEPVATPGPGGPIMEEGYEGINPGTKTNPLRYYLLNTSVHFLESYSHLNSFLGHVEASELNGPDYNVLRSKINSTIGEMEKARDFFNKLVQIADEVPHYRAEVIDALNHFDYGAFRKRENNRIKEDVFNRVKGYLANGKIKEMYRRILLDYDEILEMAYKIKAKLDAPEFPEISDLREIDHLFSQAYNFGKYAAQIFAEIKKRQPGKM